MIIIPVSAYKVYYVKWGNDGGGTPGAGCQWFECKDAHFGKHFVTSDRPGKADRGRIEDVPDEAKSLIYKDISGK